MARGRHYRADFIYREPDWTISNSTATANEPICSKINLFTEAECNKNETGTCSSIIIITKIMQKVSKYLLCFYNHVQ
jgi:hypothetical protein